MSTHNIHFCGELKIIILFNEQKEDCMYKSEPDQTTRYTGRSGPWIFVYFIKYFSWCSTKKKKPKKNHTHTIATDKALFFIQKMLISFLFLNENICCRYSLEAPRWGTSNGYPQHMFSLRSKKNIMWIPPFICSYAQNEVSLYLCMMSTLDCASVSFSVQEYLENQSYFSVLMSHIPLPVMLVNHL